MASAALKQLSSAHCILLAVHYASESNLDSLRVLVQSRDDAFTSSLSLQIILTYLPETVDPALYNPLLAQVAALAHDEAPTTTTILDATSVADISDTKAHKLQKHLILLPLDSPSCPASLADDVLARFLIHRAHRIADAGILTLIPQLIDPFLDNRPFLRTWFVSNILPLLRSNYEYYTDEAAACSLEQLELTSGDQAVATLLSQSLASKPVDGKTALARDLRCLVGPWMYGSTDRKRRKLSGKTTRQRRMSEYNADSRQYGNELDDETDGDQKHAEVQAQWDAAFMWMTKAAAGNFPVIAETLDAWDGPSDVDLGGYDRNSYMEDDLLRKLETRYAQTAFASVYAADTASKEAITHAHGVLVRTAHLMDFEPPPDLATSVDMLPKIDDRKGFLEELTSHVLKPDALLDPNHPLTNPAKDTFALLQLFVFSSYMFLELGHPLSIVTSARVRFQFDAEEQKGVISRMLNTLTANAKQDDGHWTMIRSRLLWLWGWGMVVENDGEHLGHGIFGKIGRGALEKEILKALLNTGCYNLVVKTYIDHPDPTTTLSQPDVEQVLVATALNHYDNASNGNKTRGGVKKAVEIITAFRKHFPTSNAFVRCNALLAATHSLSFYSLTLQHGIPFKPVNIRVSSDPISLLEKVLAQNPRSYANLDDLISIATNFVTSGVGSHEGVLSSASNTARDKSSAERRVIGMAIDAALNEDDFETAYSYVVTRLSLPGTTEEKDDLSWRAALAAGRHKSSALSTASTLRRLEQRMELLSQTLLLAPPNALPEILNVWRKCEEEQLALQAQENEDEQTFNSRAEQGLPGAFINTTSIVQPRREVGRGASEESPMGLFDVARGAAAVFSRNAFPLRSAAAAAQPVAKGHSRELSNESEGGTARVAGVRKRDMLSSAVTGGLASGIGWVIGAPAQQK